MTTIWKTLEDRGLDVERLVLRGWEVQSAKGGGDRLAIPFPRDGVLSGHKFRRFDSQEHKWSAKWSEHPIAYNEDCLRDPSLHGLPLLITEGEMDAEAAIQCGFLKTISVPNGCGGTSTGESISEGAYKWLRDIEPLLSKDRCPEIILGVDGDEAGARLMHELSIQLGRFRCKYLSYPRTRRANVGRDRLKDLNEVLGEYGAKGVVEVMNRADWVQVKGVSLMSRLPPVGADVIYEVGFEGLSKNMKFRLGDFIVITGCPGFGKALSLDTPLPTPLGWTTMGEVRVGDELYDEAGNVCRVTAATEVQHGRDCFVVKFDDGTEVVADRDHLWLTSTEAARRSARNNKTTWEGRDPAADRHPRGTDQSHKRTFPSVVNTAQIAASLVVNKRVNHQVALCGPVAGPDLSVPIHPYVLGAWLGDGTSVAAIITSGDADGEEMCAILTDCGVPVRAHKRATGWSIGLTTGYGRGSGKIVRALRNLGVLGNKHIPPAYLRLSPSQRVALLQGLMDTDGSVTAKGHCEFCSTTEVLAKGVLELALSLGIKAVMYTGAATVGGKDCGAKYRVCFTTNLPVFRLARKSSRLPTALPRNANRAIVSVTPTTSVPVRCIQVSSPNSLYLCSQAFIPTHNTTFLNDVCCRVAQAYKIRIAWCSLEQDPTRDHRRALRSWTLEEHPRNWLPGDVAIADQWIDRHHVFIVPDEEEDTDLNWLLDCMEAAVVRYEAKIIVIDPANEIERRMEAKENESDYHGRFIRTLKRFAKRMQVVVVVVAHPAKMQKVNGKYPEPSLYDISGSAHYINKADLGIIVHREDADSTIVRVSKSRYWDIIGRPGVMKLGYNPDTRRFVEEERLA